jgi:lysozyme
MPDPAAAKAGSAIPSATYSGHQAAPASASPSAAPSPSGSRSASPSASAAPAAPASASAPGTPAEQAFINQVAAGAIAAQHTYGVPASVTIAQAIDESAWGQSTLAAQDHNLFGIKGAGPAGSVSFPTQEFQNGQWVTISAQFRAYHDVTQSIEDHGKLLATSGYYTAAMAARNAPDQFAQALTGVYATNPSYGSNLISLMQRYNLYRFDAGSQSAVPSGTTTPRGSASAPPTASGSGARAGTSAPSPKASTPTTTPATRVSAAPGTRASSPAAKPAANATAPSLTTPHATSAPAATPHATATPRATPSVAATPHVVPTPTGTPTTAAGPLPTSHATASAAPVRGQASPVSAPASRPPAQPATGPVPHPFATPQTATPQSPAPQATAPPAAATPPDQAAIPGILSTAAATSTHTSAALHSSPGMARPRSSADTQVVAELAAVFRPTAPGGNPAPVTETASHSAPRSSAAGTPAAKRAQPGKSPAHKKPAKRKSATAKARKPAPRYHPQMPTPVKNAFLATARQPLARAELMYRDVAGTCGISWKLLAACDWMQCEAHPRYSPVNGEKLGTVNADGTVFRTKSEALTQCANDLIDLAGTVYQIDLTVPVELSVPELARVFAAFRWGGLLRLHHTSAMEFPYSVQGLTQQHVSMRWPRIAEPNTPDKPGARFRRPFGAVPVVLSLEYPATV